MATFTVFGVVLRSSAMRVGLNPTDDISDMRSVCLRSRLTKIVRRRTISACNSSFMAFCCALDSLNNGVRLLSQESRNLRGGETYVVQYQIDLFGVFVAPALYES